jgi:hypothetical protein
MDGGLAMTKRVTPALSALVLAFCAAPAEAGPCTDEIYQADIALGKRLDAAAASGKTGSQSTFATMHRQPTPATVAGAEARLGDLPPAEVDRIEKFLDDARAADAANKKPECEAALAEARKLLGP